MELLSTDHNFILVNGEHSLWINRQTSAIATRTGANSFIAGATCLGTVHGYLGKVSFGEGLDSRLIFIRQQALVGILDGCEIFKILSVVSVPIESDVELILEPCAKHAPHAAGEGTGHLMSQSQSDGRVFSPATFEYTGQRNLYKVTTMSVPGLHFNQPAKTKRSEKLEKAEKRVLEEFHKMFTEADSFYYSAKFDLTNAIQRQILNSESKTASTPVWYYADNRFFWNYYMLNDLFQSKDANVDRWIIPMIQGFIEHGRCELGLTNDPSTGLPGQGQLHLWLVSRRSRYRAGTRYLRRGIDENGKVANYVETEQIMVFEQHKTSFVQVRGSIPLYWSQPGQRYRPSPRLERSEEETYAAFRTHFIEEGSIYGPITIVNLVDKTGKEKILGDAYLSIVLTHNSPDLVYLSFDFHEHCRGMHFENVSLLIDKLDDCFNHMSYCWVDSYGLVLKQKGVLRVNCIDCLDRTNVVQTHIGKHVLQVQLSKLGLLSPEVGLASNIRVKLQSMWANNGDTISRQYAGTNALKGDYTRTGERKLTSALKDGMNSASRYYLNRFRDTQKQAAIDLMLGEKKNLTEDELDDPKAGEEKENTVEQIKIVIEDAKKCIVPKYAVILGSWGLVNARKNDPDEIDIDTIFILTDKNYYSTEYDCNMDSITETEMVNLHAVISIELGFEKLSQPSRFWTLFGQNQSNYATHSSVPCLRITYKHNGEPHCHEFRSSSIRFFNNVAVPIQHPEEMLEALKMIAESVQIATGSVGNKVGFHQTEVLPPRPVSSTHIAPFSSSWVHKYFSFGMNESDSTDIKKQPSKVSALSFERFTPKYFRKTSGARFDANGEVLTTINSRRVGTELKSEIQNTALSSSLDVDPDFKNSTSISSQEPIQHFQQLALRNSGDLLLPSCGVIAFSSSRNLSIDLRNFYPSDSTIPSVKSNYEISNVSPFTAVAHELSPITTEERAMELPEVQPSTAALSRHRHSLPVQSVSVDFPGRLITPEIRITEDTSSVLTKIGEVEKSVFGIPLISKRMSKSTEEIVHEIVDDRIVRIQPLMPSLTKENRSSSTQNICTSSLNMKASRSDNALVGKPSSVRTGSLNPISKESVLVPLGKLARGMQKSAIFFDPRKLKDTFKPTQAKKEVQVECFKEDREYLLMLEERKRNCKSVIIEL